MGDNSIPLYSIDLHVSFVYCAHIDELELEN